MRVYKIKIFSPIISLCYGGEAWVRIQSTSFFFFNLNFILVASNCIQVGQSLLRPRKLISTLQRDTWSSN